MSEAGYLSDWEYMAKQARESEVLDAIIRERQLVALYLHQFAGSQVDPVEVAGAVLTGAHMVAT